jgi:hypothetical protein
VCVHERPTLKILAAAAVVLALALAGCGRKLPYAIPVLNNLKIPVTVGVCQDAVCTDVKGAVILGPGDGYDQPANGSAGAVTWLVLKHPDGGRIGCLRSVPNGTSTGTLIRASHHVPCP